MQIDMAVEEPNTGIVCFEADDNVAVGGYYITVSLERYAGQRALVAVPGSGTTSDDLEDVTLML
jgi:hypothetical protein